MQIGPYSLHGTIAAGGFGQVDYATIEDAPGVTRLVAVKRVRADRTVDGALEMLADEARLVSRIRHPNVIGVLDVLRSDSELFVVMEYVDGETLAFFLRRARKRDESIPLPIVSAIMVGALEGLHAAHEATDEGGAPLGIVHRDVSLPNIMVGTDGRSRILDFGVAKAEGRIQSTSIGELKGKLAYMAPEQLALQPVTRRSDVYAVGVVLWELITTRRLFDSPDGATTIEKVLKGDVEPPSRYASGVPLALEQLVLRALSRDPALRFESGAEMARALAECLPPAPAAEIAAWVSFAAADSLSRRRSEEGRRAAMPTMPDELPDQTINEAVVRRTQRRGRALPSALALGLFVFAVAAMTFAVVRFRLGAGDTDAAVDDAGAATALASDPATATATADLVAADAATTSADSLDAAVAAIETSPADANVLPTPWKGPRRWHRHPRRLDVTVPRP